MSSHQNNVHASASSLSFQSSSASNSNLGEPQDPFGAYSAYIDQRQPKGSHQSAGKINVRNTFIAPELAYSQEKKKFFDKIGLNRRSSKFPQTIQMDQPKKQTTGTISGQTQIAKQEKQTEDGNSSMMQAEMPLTQPKEVDQKFMRRRNRADDTYYEKRVQTLSKIRQKKNQLLNDSTEGQGSKGQNSSNVIKRLMTIRKQRQAKDQADLLLGNGDIESPSHYMTIMKGYSYNSRTEANVTSTQNKEVTLQPLQNESISQIGLTTDQSQPILGSANFMSRRQFRKGTDYGNQSILPRRQKSNQQSVENRYNKPSSFILMEKDGASQNLDRSMINTASTYRGASKITVGQRMNQALQNNIPKMMNIQQDFDIPGFSSQDLIDLFQAKCKDLKITSSKDQMIRFFEIVKRNQQGRKLIFADMGLGDNSVQVISRIIKKNEYFSSLDLRKNFITNEGIKYLASSLEYNTTLVHLNIGCNQISTEGAMVLFESLKYQQSITSVSFGNSDCYKNKNKIGTKAAQVLGELLKTNQLIQILDLTDTSISQEGMAHIISGLKHSPHIVSVNLSQNDLGSSQASFQKLLTIFKPSKTNANVVSVSSLEELVLSSNQLTNKSIEDLGATLKGCEKTKLQRLDLSNNKLTSKAFLTLISTLRSNQQLKLTHLTLDKMNLEPGSQQESQINYQSLMRQITDYLSNNKSTLQYLSLCQCSLKNDMMNAIGRGLLCNDKLETLVLRSNQIEDEGLNEIIDTLQQNKNLKLKSIDFSSNRLSDKIGAKLAQAMAQAQTLNQVFLRDNNFGNESGEAFLFLVKQKQNLWKLQLDMNIIKYMTLMEIDKYCKRNKAYYLSMNLPEFKQQIKTFNRKKDPKVKQEDLDGIIKYQSRQIQEGMQKVFNEEEEVHSIIQMGQQNMQQYDNKKRTLHNILAKQDELLHELDLQSQAKEREFLKKLEVEISLLERCREYTRSQQTLLNKETAKVERRRQVMQADEEDLKLRTELQKIQREHQMLLVIVDNYEKEIERVKRKQDELQQQESLQRDDTIGNESRETSEERTTKAGGEKRGLFGMVRKQMEYEVTFSKDTNSFKKKRKIKKKANTSVNNTASKPKKGLSLERPKVTKFVQNLIQDQCA